MFAPEDTLPQHRSRANIQPPPHHHHRRRNTTTAAFMIHSRHDQARQRNEGQIAKAWGVGGRAWRRSSLPLRGAERSSGKFRGECGQRFYGSVRGHSGGSLREVFGRNLQGHSEILLRERSNEDGGNFVENSLEKDEYFGENLDGNDGSFQERWGGNDRRIREARRASDPVVEGPRRTLGRSERAAMVLGRSEGAAVPLGQSEGASIAHGQAEGAAMVLGQSESAAMILGQSKPATMVGLETEGSIALLLGDEEEAVGRQGMELISSPKPKKFAWGECGQGAPVVPDGDSERAIGGWGGGRGGGCNGVGGDVGGGKASEKAFSPFSPLLFHTNPRRISPAVGASANAAATLTSDTNTNTNNKNNNGYNRNNININPTCVPTSPSGGRKPPPQSTPRSTPPYAFSPYTYASTWTSATMKQRGFPTGGKAVTAGIRVFSTAEGRGRVASAAATSASAVAVVSAPAAVVMPPGRRVSSAVGGRRRRAASVTAAATGAAEEGTTTVTFRGGRKRRVSVPLYAGKAVTADKMADMERVLR